MAEEIALRITTDGSQAEKSVKSIRQELKEAQQNAVNLARQFGELSPEALEAAKKVALLRDEFADLNDRISALNPDAKFKAFSQSLQGVAGGFAGLQGAIGLFGTESAELEKQLLKVQSALALSEGINSVLAAKDSFRTLGVLIRTNVVKAFSTLRGAIIATGIGALVVGVGLLIANFDAVKKAVLNAVPGLAKVGEVIGKVVQKITDFVGITSEAERASERITKASKSRNEEIDRQIKLLQAQGGREKEIAQLQKEKADNQIKSIQAVGRAEKKLTEEQKKELKDLQNEKRVIDAQEKKRLSDIADQQKKEAQQRAKEAAQRAKEAEEARLLAIGEIRVKQRELEEQALLEAANRQEKANTDFLERVNNTALSAALIDENSKIQQNQRDFAAYQAQEELEKLTFEAKKKRLEETANLLTNLGAIVGQQTAAGKALGIATALINTYQGATEALKEKSTLPQPFSTIARFAAAGAIIANGLRTVKQIASVKVPGGGGGSSQGGGNPISGTSANIPTQAPIASSVQVQQTSLTPGGNQVDINGQSTVKAFVVERDITDSQDRIAKIKAAATI